MIQKFNSMVLAKLTAIFLLSMSSLTSYATIYTITGEEGGGLGSNFSMLFAGTPGGITGGATDIDGTFDDSKICDVTACNDYAMTLSTNQLFFNQPWTARAIRVFNPGTYTIDTDCTEEDMNALRFDCDPTALRPTGPNGDPVVSDPTLNGGLDDDTTEGPNITFTVAIGQLGGHMLFDWNQNTNINVPILWDYKQTFTVPTDPAFPLEDQTFIYNGQDFGQPVCTGVGVPNVKCDTTQTSSRVWQLASRDGDTPAVQPTGTPDGVRGFAMVNGPFIGQNANFNLDFSPVINAPPIANDDSAGATADIATDIDVIANDTDIEDTSPPPAPPAIVTPTTATSAQGFALTANPDGTINYAPTGGYVGGDSFLYTLTDSGGAVSFPATVSITVTAAPNTPPVTTDPTIPTNEDTAVDIAVADAATDADMDPLTYALFDVASANGGTVTVDMTNTTLTYAPPVNFNGLDTFAYTVNDGIADSNVGTMTIDVAPVNDALVCTDVTLSTDVDSVLPINVANDLLSTCTDPDTGDTITLDSTTQPTVPGSMLTYDGVNTLTYAPAADFQGPDMFTYTATDGSVFDTRTVNINVGVLLGNFTMLDSNGDVFGGTNDVIVDWDGTTNDDQVDYTNNLNFNMSIESAAPWPFFGFVWTAHNVRVFGPGTYSFDSGCTVTEIQTTGCPAGSAANTGPAITMTVGPGQFGAHILFDWNTSTNIDVVNVWDVDGVWDMYGATAPTNALWAGLAGDSPDPTTTWDLVSRDVNGDLRNGAPMVDGPFQGFYANFNDGPAGTSPPPEPYTGTAPDTKIGSGLFASPMNPWVLIAVFMTLFGARRLGKSLYC